MEIENIQNLNFTSKFTNFEVVNSEFTKCRCYILATGDNVNGSDITEEAVDKAIARGEFYNKPIVAHLYKDPDTGEIRVGGHDSKIVITSDSIEFINECVPFGVIPESANIHKERVLEPDGITYNIYAVGDILLWTGRYNIMDAAYDSDVYFNQSCEIGINDYHYKNNGVFAIDDFTFSACCLLNRSNDASKNVLPCFPSCRVEKIGTFSIDENSFKANFELMLKKLKSYESDVKPVQDKNNFKKEENTNMNREKILEALSAVTYENALGETVPQYGLIDISETSVGVIDRQDNKAYSVNWAESEDTVVLDFDNRVECSFTVKEKADEDFDYAAEVTLVSEFASKVKENELTASTSEVMAKEMEKFNAQVTELTTAYNELKADYDVKSAELDKYRADDEKRKIEKHNADVEALYNKFSAKIGRVPEFLCYRANTENKQKDLEIIEAELTVMAGKAMMNKNTKQNFSFEPVSAGIAPVVSEKELAYANRYGNLLDKWKKD